MAGSGERIGRAILELLVEGDAFYRDLDEAESRTKKVGQRIGDVGKALLPVSALFAGVGIAAVKFATDLNASMANVATLIPGNTARVQELKGVVQDLAVATGQSTGDLADGLYNVVSAFGDTADTAAILDTNARAAAAGLATTTDAINLTSAVTKAYGDTSAGAVQQVSDLAFTAVRLGQTTFPELAASIGRVTPLTSELGVAQQELFAVMATATGVTGGAAEVSTQLRGVLQSLMAPTADMAALYQHLGVSSGEALLEQEGLQGTMALIVQAAEASGQPLQKFISSIEGQTLALTLTGAQADSYVQKLGEMQEATGATDEAFREQSEGVNAAGFAWNQLKQEFIVAGQQLGDRILPVLLNVAKALRPVVDWVKQGVEWFGKLPQPVQTVAVVLGAVIAALGPVLIGVGALVAAIGSAMPVLSAIGGALAGVAIILTGPVGLAIAAAVAAWVFFGDEISAIVQQTVGVIWTWLVDNLSPVASAIGNILSTVGGFFWSLFGFVKEAIGLIVDVLWAGVQLVADVLINRLRPILEAVGTGFQVLWTVIDTVFVQPFVKTIGWLGEKLQQLTGYFRSAREQIAGEEVPAMVTSTTEQLAILDTAVTDVGGSFQGLRTDVGGTRPALEGFTGAAKAGSDAAKDAAKALEEQRRELRSLGLVTEREVNTQLEKFAALERLAADEGVPLRDVLEAIQPKLMALAREAHASGLASEVLADRLAEVNAELAILRGMPAGLVVTPFDGIIPTIEGLRSVSLEGTYARMEADRLTGAFSTLGLTSRAELEATAAYAREAYATMARAGWESAEQEKAARQAVLEAERAAAGETIGIWEGQVLPSIVSVGQAMRDSISDHLTGMLTFTEGFKEGFVGIWQSIKGSVMGIFSSIVKGFVDTVIGGIMNSLRGAQGGIGSLFGGMFGGAGGAAGGGGGGLFGGLGGVLGAIPGWGWAAAGIGAGVAGLVGLFHQGNDTKKAREQFAGQFGGYQSVLDQLNKFSERTGDTRGWELVNEALNKIGKTDTGANQAWMAEVLQILTTVEDEAATTAEAIETTSAAAADSTVEAYASAHDRIQELELNLTETVAAEADARTEDERQELQARAENYEQELARLRAEIGRTGDEAEATFGKLFGDEDTLRGQVDRVTRIAGDLARNIHDELGALKFTIPVDFDLESPEGGFGVPGAETEPIPSFADRPLEAVTGDGLAMLHRGDVVGVPRGGGGDTFSVVINTTKPIDQTYLRGDFRKDFSTALREDPDLRRDMNRGLTGG